MGQAASGIRGPHPNQRSRRPGGFRPWCRHGGKRPFHPGLPSTAAKGKISKIVPLLDEGAAVTTSRNDIDYAVTEYGIAKLKGRTLRQRALALIEIAHPDFRDGLRKVFEERFPGRRS